MTLSTHAVVGAGLAVVAQANPAVAFGLGFLSHFLLDAIPHWDYPLQSSNDHSDPMEVDMIFGKAFVLDIISIGIDFFLGLYLGLLLLSTHHTTFSVTIASPIFWGALGAMIPDFFQFVYFKFRVEPFRSLQRFHMFIHSDYRFPNRSFLGPFIQIVLILAILFFLILAH